MPGHFQQKFPEGQLSDVQGELEANGIALAIWIALINSADSQPKVDKIRAIFENATIQADLDNFVAHGSAHVDLTGPTMEATFESLEFYPDELSDIQSTFADSGASSVASSVVRQELTTSKDRHEQLTANKGIIKLMLPFVSAKIVDGKIEASSAKRPIVTIAMKEIQDTPPSGMKENLSDTLRCYFGEKAKSLNPTNAMDNCSLSFIPVPVLESVVKGRWIQEVLTQVTYESQMNNFSLMTFRPQDLKDFLLQEYLNEEASNRNQNKSDGASSKKLRALLATVADMDDHFASKCLINSRQTMSALFDFEKMAAEANHAIFDDIATQLTNWFMLQATNHFPKWRVNTGKKMDYLGALLVQWGELFFVACGKFANSLHNVSVFSDPEGDVTTLDFSAFDDFLKDFKTFKEEITSKQRTMAAYTAIPALFIAANKHLTKEDDVSPRQPPQLRDDSGSRDNRSLRQQQSPREQNDDAGNGQGTPKRQKPSPSGNGSSVRIPPEQNGILCLREGVTLDEGFPTGFPACKKFVTRGFTCPFGDNCSANHWNKLAKASNHNKKRWIEHLRATRVAFFNMWKLGHGLTANDSELQGIVGPPGLPPPRE